MQGRTEAIHTVADMGSCANHSYAVTDLRSRWRTHCYATAAVFGRYMPQWQDSRVTHQELHAACKQLFRACRQHVAAQCMIVRLL